MAQMGTDLPQLDEEAPAPRWIVPASVHPGTSGDELATLALRAERVDMVALDVDGGPGPRRDEACAEAVRKLVAAGIGVLGRVDVGHGRRPRHDVVADVGCFVLWYKVAGILFDRVPVAADEVAHAARLAHHARLIGVRTVVFAHGAHPAEAYAEHADILGTFEGPWASYVDLAVPAWAQVLSARTYHVVYGVPAGSLGLAGELARRRRVGYVYLTDSALGPRR